MKKPERRLANALPFPRSNFISASLLDTGGRHPYIEGAKYESEDSILEGLSYLPLDFTISQVEIIPHEHKMQLRQLPSVPNGRAPRREEREPAYSGPIAKVCNAA